MAQIRKRQMKEEGDTCGFFSNATANTYGTGATRLTGTLTNAPPGDYIIEVRFAVMPTGGGNASLNLSCDSSGTLSANNVGIHSGGDADYNTGKYAHRNSISVLKSHPGGTFTVTLTHSPESSVNFVYRNASDGRWATILVITKAG